LEAVIKQLTKHTKSNCRHAVKSQEHMDHKKICRSKSHRPRTQTHLTEKQGEKSDKVEKIKNTKPPLRKYNSFPYHMFMNETGYSSDESMKSAFEEKRWGKFSKNIHAEKETKVELVTMNETIVSCKNVIIVDDINAAWLYEVRDTRQCTLLMKSVLVRFLQHWP